MFDQLLLAYPDVHPEDFVTYGILQEQPRRGSAREWGEVAGVLENMVAGRYTLLRELAVVMNRIARMDRADPMRATEEMALVDIIRRERRRSRVPLGRGAFALLAAPGGPMSRPAPRDTRRRPPPPPTDDPRPGPSGAQGGPTSPQRHRGRGRRRGPARPPPPPGFVDLTADNEEMVTPATPPPQVSYTEEMDIGEEDALLASPGHHHDNSDEDEDGFQHV